MLKRVKEENHHQTESLTCTANTAYPAHTHQKAKHNNHVSRRDSEVAFYFFSRSICSTKTEKKKKKIMRESVAKEKTINELLNRMCLFLIPNIYKYIVSKQYLNENRCPFQLFSSREVLAGLRILCKYLRR